LFLLNTPTQGLCLLILNNIYAGYNLCLYVCLFVCLFVCGVSGQLRYGGGKAKPGAASVVRTAGNASSVLLGHLAGSSTYSISLRAYNSAGFGPPSAVVNVTTKKPRKSAGRLGGGAVGG